MISPILSEHEQLARLLAAETARLEALIMALTDSVANLTTAINDLSADLGATLVNQQRILAAMQVSIDRLTSDDAADKATIQRLSDQIAAMTADSNAAVSQLDALAEAVRQADVPINQPPAGQPA